MILQFNLGDKCNLNCYYCKSDRNRAIQIVDNLDKHKERLHEIRDKYNPAIAITGQEPTLSMERVRKVIDIFEEGAKIQPSFYMLTNGTQLDRELVRYCNEHNVFITISFDGKDSYKEYDVFADRGAILLGIKKLKFVGLLTDKSYPLDIFRPIEEFDRKYYKIHGYHVAVTLEALLPLEGEYRDCISDFKRLKKEMDTIYSLAEMGDSKFIYYDYKKTVIGRLNISDYFCGICNEYFNVDMDGNITMCYQRDIVLGTIYDDFNGIIDKAKSYFKVSSKCQSCTLEKYCHRGCPLTPLKIKGTHCKYSRAMYGGLP